MIDSYCYKFVCYQAIEELRHKIFLEETNRTFQKLKNNTALWNEELDERNEWDVIIHDRLEDE